MGKTEENLNHVDLCLKRAEEAEQVGDKERAKYFLNLAEKFEKALKRIASHNIQIEQKKKTGGFNA